MPRISFASYVYNYRLQPPFCTLIGKFAAPYGEFTASEGEFVRVAHAGVRAPHKRRARCAPQETIRSLSTRQRMDLRV
eukprot:985067-Prorocentrum_minimum.AAC.1